MFLRALILFMFSGMALSQQANIEVLEEGTCWAQNSENILKMSSFVEGLAVEVPRYNFKAKVADQFNIDESDIIDMSYHCSSSKSWLLVNIQSDTIGACLHFKLDRKGLVLESVNSNPRELDGSCQGIAIGELLVFKELSQDQIDHLYAEYPVENIDSRRRFTKITLYENHYLKERKVRDKLLQDSKLNRLNFEYNSIVLPVGTRLPMN